MGKVELSVLALISWCYIYIKIHVGIDGGFH